jgi:hypothetical protein
MSIKVEDVILPGALPEVLAEAIERGWTEEFDVGRETVVFY